MKKYYDLSFSKQVVSHLPALLRKDRIMAYLSVLIRPLEELQLQFKSYITAVETDVHTQVYALRALLNNHFDYYERRIRIKEVEINFDDYLMWQNKTSNRIMLGKKESKEPPCLLSRKGQLGRNNPDFEVTIPVGFRLQESEEMFMRSIINNNKLVSKKYIIKHG